MNPLKRPLRAAPVSRVVASPDYTLAAAVSFSGGGLVYTHAAEASYWASHFPLDLPLVVFGVFLAFQTARTRFVFDGSAFEVTKQNLDAKNVPTDNFVVGGRSRWEYDTIQGYRFVPSRLVPALLYFTETSKSTAPEPPQMHLCPVLGNAREIDAEFRARGVRAL